MWKNSDYCNTAIEGLRGFLPSVVRITTKVSNNIDLENDELSDGNRLLNISSHSSQFEYGKEEDNITVPSKAEGASREDVYMMNDGTNMRSIRPWMGDSQTGTLSLSQFLTQA